MYLYGASGHAKVIIDILKSQNIDILGLFDDNPSIKQLLDFPVLGKYDSSIVGKKEIIISVGNNIIRKAIESKISSSFGRAFHKTAIISKYSKIDVGTVIMHEAIIQANVEIGKHVIINTASIIEHDNIIQDFVHISPNATLCGNVFIGEGTHIGASAVVIPGKKIGKWCKIGAGSVIINDIPDNVTVVGNPGKIIKGIK